MNPRRRRFNRLARRVRVRALRHNRFQPISDAINAAFDAAQIRLDATMQDILK
jgi:hypothetical protein